MATVSVIIPTYNRAAMVKEAIRSVLAQTYTDYEIIVVDDGSTDNTRGVVTALSDKVIYVYQKNRGRAAARNHGIQAAQGEYVAFLDSDDRFLPNKLHVQVQALRNDPTFGMAYSYIIRIDENGNVVPGDRRARARLSGWIYPQLLFIKGTVITTPSVMVRRRVLNEIGGFDETMHVCEDLDLWRRIARSYKVLQIEEPLSVVRYRLNDRPALLESVQARSYYYRKAIAEDPVLKDSTRSKLFSEMYWYYGSVALVNKNTRLALQLLAQSAKAGPLELPRCLVCYLPSYLYHGAVSRLGRFLSSRLSAKEYSRIREVYGAPMRRN